jgi:hypothetical protein
MSPRSMPLASRRAARGSIGSLAKSLATITRPTAKIIARIKWFIKRGSIGNEAFVKWHKWLLGTHRISQYDHMRPEYRYRLPEIEARYREHVAKLGG